MSTLSIDNHSTAETLAPEVAAERAPSDVPDLTLAAPSLKHNPVLDKSALEFNSESPARTWVGGTFAWLIAIAWFAVFHLYWTPAHSGVDQNGYLVGGRMFADHLSTGMSPPDFFGFVGRMWIGTPWQTYYPKYPIGLPILYAGLLKLGSTPAGPLIAFLFGSIKWGLLPVGIFFVLRTVLESTLSNRLRRFRALCTPLCLILAIVATALVIRSAIGPISRLPFDGPSAGVNLCYLLSPVSMALALVATYQLVRLMAGTLGGILAMLTVGCSPVTLELTNNPNSHATTLFCVTWGMFLLIRWWQAGGAWRASLAGLLMGYAVTIRYTEGMLVLPILLVALFNLNWRNKCSWIETAMLLAWWAIPVMFLVAFNLGAFGAVTGYDSTNESTGFHWEYFFTNWELTVRQIYNTGIFFVLPFSLAGLVVMYFRSWKMALVVTSWILPSLVLYSAYYWAPDGQTIGYMRFYLTIFPPLCLTAFWLLVKVLPEILNAGPAINHPGKSAAGGIATAGTFAVIAGGVLLMTLGDARFERANPMHEDSTPAFVPPRQARLQQRDGRGPGPGANPMLNPQVNRGAHSEQIAKAWADDKARFASSFRFLSWRLPFGAAVAGLLLAAFYALAYRFSGRSLAVLGTGCTAAVLVAGLVALASCAMNLYSAEPEMESGFRAMLNCDQTATLLVKDIAAPEGSLIFSDDTMLNHLQFVADYQVYDQRQFTIGYVRTLSPDRFDPTAPNPLQLERAADIFRLVGKYSENQLLAEQQKIVEQAFGAGKHVYVVIPLKQLSNTTAWYFPAGKFKTTRKMVWQEPTAAQPRYERDAHWQGFTPNFRQAQRAADPALWTILEIQPRNQ
jgi:hypothetical protein